MKKPKILILYFLLCFLNVAWAQTTVTGVVMDEASVPLPGVNVIVKGTNVGVVSDFDGRFSIEASLGDILEITYLGMKTQSLAISNFNPLTIKMEEDATQLEDVVVIGYGTQKKEDVTGAIASIQSDDFNQGIANSPEQLLQGKISGVNVTSASGAPGAAMNITIRGPGSVRSGSSPLFVVDGVPINNTATTPNSESLGLGSSGPSNPLSFLNPSDIASMDVLKDASATAIYGSRGANGVILITTKRGTRGSSGITYNSSIGVSQVAKKIDLLSTQEFTDFTNAQGNPSNILGGDTDWQNQIYRTAYTHNHNISFSGGAQNTNYFASLNYMDQEGVIKNSDLKRYTARVNADQNFLDNRLKVKFNLTASFTRTDAPPISDNGDSTGDMLTNALNANPTFPTHNPDGTLFNFPNGYNPLMLLDIYNDFAKTNRVLGNLEVGYELFEGLEYRVNFGIDNSVSQRVSQMSPHNIPNLSNATGRLVDATSENTNQVIDNYLTYRWSNDNHNLTMLVGHSYQKFAFQSRRWSINNFSTNEIEAYHNPGIGTSLDIGNNRPGGSAYENELQSFFGRGSYDFKSRYLFTATVRADGSSKFGKDNRYGIFPSFAGAWRISNEEFLRHNVVISDLKLRVGWGRTGSQEIPPYITRGQLNVSTGSGSGYAIDGDQLVAGYNFVRTPNEKIKWEVSTQTDVGLDFGFFQGKLYGSLDYFDKTTSDILWRTSATADPINPTSEYWSNYDMQIHNRGVEAALGYRFSSGDFSGEFGGNITFIENEITNSPVSILTTGNLTGPGLTGVPVNGYLNGNPIGTFYLLDFIGFDESGNNIFRDVNNDGTINNDDRVTAGSALPKTMFNLNASLSYRNFDFSANFNGVSGNKLYNNTENAYFNYPILAAGNNVSRNVLDNTDESTTNSATPSTRYLYDASFFRLNNATLGYNINMGEFSSIKSVKVYFTGQNLFIITDYPGFDPEVDTPKNANGFRSYGIDFSSYPKARTFILGLSVTL